ncbi:LPS-assembly protein LptD [bacterium]|nr:LPS-assembly protein LptD [bacterium]
MTFPLGSIGFWWRKYLRSSVVVTTIFLSNFSSAQNKITFSSDEYETNLKTKVTHASGNVKVQIQSRELRADDVEYLSNEQRINATGNVVLIEKPYKIVAAKATVSTDDSTGVFFDAVLTSDSGVYMSGSKIESLGDQKFKIVNGKVSLCQDCPQAWSVFGASIELELEGYAEVNHALFQIKDQPIAYFPIFYFPIKVKRQSGFLLPRYIYSPEVGSQIGQPYFWAISKDQDATFEYRFMTEGGHRLGMEHRYLYSSRTFSNAKISYNKNISAENVDEHRYGLSISERYQLGPHWVQRYLGEIASDPRYTSSFDEDFNDYRMPALSSRLSLAWQDENSVFWVQGIANRNNLIRNESNNTSLGAIHLLPELIYSYPSINLVGPVLMTGTIGRQSFRRSGGPIDPITDWIREGDRSSGQLRIYAPFYVFNVLLSESLVEMRADHYQFAPQVSDTTAYRARVTLEEKLNAQLSKVYDVDWGELQAIKHTIEPSLSWGYSPNDWRSTHDFFNQPYTAGGSSVSSPKFDIFDPRDSEELSKLGTANVERRLGTHHLLSWGLGSRLIGRVERNGSKEYTELFGMSVSQDVDIKTRVGENINISAFGGYNGYRLATEMSINPGSGDANFRNEFSVTKPRFDIRLIQSIREDLEQYGGDLVLRILQPWTFGASGSYDAITDTFIEENYKILYESTKAKCWFFSFDVQRKADPNNVGQTITRYWPKVGFIYKAL